MMPANGNVMSAIFKIHFTDNVNSKGNQMEGMFSQTVL